MGAGSARPVVSPRRRPVPMVQPFWSVQIEADSLAHLAAVAARRGITVEDAVRDAITWWTARASLWELRTRSIHAASVTAAAEAFDPVGALLAEPLERAVNPPAGLPKDAN